MVQPLKYDGSNTLQDMTDAELDRLRYYTQVAYAAQLNAAGNGHVNVAGSGTDIGTATDTSSTQQINSVTRILNNGIIETYPGYPGIGSETDASYTYRQLRSVPSAVTSGTFNSYGMVFFDAGNDIEPFSTEAQIADRITNQCITNMRTGDEVGSYRVATTTPTSGGAGTWTSKGTFFSDTTYSAGTTTYILYLKTALSSVPGSNIYPVGLYAPGGTPDGNLAQRDIINSSALVQNILLPSLTRKMSSGLYYTVATSVSGINRGAFTNTRQLSTSNTQNFTGSVYQAISTPTGTASTVTTYYLNMIA